MSTTKQSNEATHTPGPWQHVGGSIMKRIGPQGDSWMDICDISNMNLGNARLISASPDLLAACERVAEYFKQNSDPKRQGIACDVFQAIRKAKGQP